MSRRLALITGGTSGIGYGIARRLAPTHDLALAYAADEAKAGAAVASLRAENPGARIDAFRGRLETRSDCESLHAGIVRAIGAQPAVFVNSLGRISDGLFLQSDFGAVEALIGEHLVVAIALTQLVVKSMYQARWGRIIHLSSISAAFAKRGQAAYASAKAGIEGFTRTLALEVAHRGVTVNAIAPGLIETPMTRDFIQRIAGADAYAGAAVGQGGAGGTGLRGRIPVGRAGRPDEVGALAAFLCSDDAAYITGTVMTIDGGRSLGDPAS